jgi:UDP-2-acetamido-3-amino-2,3-dideoxy-glucuronate N-acetyltransferase
MIHPLADVQSPNIGLNTQIWQFAVVLPQAVMGDNCNINCHTFVENDVILGHRVTVKSGVYLWDGLRIADDVFIGPNVTFTNDRQPRSKQRPATFQVTTIEKGASIGAAAVVLGGVTIGEYALIGAGSVVTRDVPPFALMRGNPARQAGWVNEQGEKLAWRSNGLLEAPNGQLFTVKNQRLEPCHA